MRLSSRRFFRRAKRFRLTSTAEMNCFYAYMRVRFIKWASLETEIDFDGIIFRAGKTYDSSFSKNIQIQTRFVKCHILNDFICSLCQTNPVFLFHWIWDKWIKQAVSLHNAHSYVRTREIFTWRRRLHWNEILKRKPIQIHRD